MVSSKTLQELMTQKWHNELLPLLQQRLQRHDAPSTGRTRYGVLLSYTGTVDTDIVPHLIQLAERSIANTGTSRKERKRVLFVCIESVQNVLHHGFIDDAGETLLYLTLELTPVGFQVHCGNLMKDHDAQDLAKRIGKINSLSHAQLRKEYIDVLCGGHQDPVHGNAGLGLISMAKRTQGVIEFEANPHSDGLHMVTLTSTIRR